MGVIGNLMFAVGFKANTKPLQDAEKSIGSLKLGVIGLGVAIGGLAVAALSAASEFEKSMSQVQMATGETAEQMEATKEVAKNLYSQNFGEDWNDLGSAIAAVRQVTGQAGEALEDTTRSALLLRDSFGYEVNESIKSVDTMMKQFGITSEQAYDLIAQGTQKGLNKSDELMDSANEYANQFAALGFSAEEMFDVFAAGSAEGVFQLDKVGDAVKEFNIRAKDGSAGSIEAFQMLGLNADKMMQTFARGGPDAKAAFSQILKMISDVEDPVLKNQIGVALLGTQFEDLEASVVAGMGNATSQFVATGDALANLNKVKFDKPGEAFAMFGRQIETGILIPIGEKMLPYLTNLGQWFADHKPQIEAFGTMIGDKVGGAIDGISLAVQASLPTLQAIWETISGVASSFAQWEWSLPIVVGLTAALVTYKGVLLAVAAAQKIQAAWTARATIKQAALNLAMSLNPIGLIIAAIVGLVAAFVIAYKKSETFRNIINGAWEGIKVAFSATMNFFTITVPEVFNKIITFIRTWGPMFLIVLTGPIGWAVALIVKYWDQIKSFTISVFSAVWAWIQSVWNGIVSSISGAVNAVWSGIVNAWNMVSAANAAIFGGIRDFLGNVWTSIVTTVTTKVTSVWTKIKEIWDRITGFLKGINLFEIGRNIIEGMVSGISSMANAVVDKVKDIGNSITEKVKGILGIHSPSRVMFQIGEWTGEGMQLGMESMQKPVSLAAGDLASSTIDSTQPNNVDNVGYTPESPAVAPARIRSATQGAMPPVIVNVTVNGGAGSPQDLGQSVAAEVARQVQAILEQTQRRMGLDSPEVNL